MRTLRSFAMGIVCGLNSMVLVIACAGDGSRPGNQQSSTGVLQMSLTGTSSSGVTYRLRGAQFAVTGTSTLGFSSEDYLDQASVNFDLASGGYIIEMYGDWTMERAGANGYEPVNAVLLSASRVAFTITNHTVTNVSFRFRAGQDVVDIGTGQLQVSIAVEEGVAGAPGVGGSAGTSVGGSDAGGSNTGGSPASGGSPCASISSLNHPTALAANEHAIVWGDATNIHTCPVTGCGASGPKSLVPSSYWPPPKTTQSIGLDATHVYWLGDYPYDNPSVWRCPWTGCFQMAEMYLDAGGSGGWRGLLVHSSSLYLRDYWSVQVYALDGSGQRDSFGQPDTVGFQFAADATGLYMTLNGEAHGTYYWADGASPPSALLPLVSTSGRLVAADGVVYVLGYGGAILSCPNTGCSDMMTTLATGQSNISSMVADSTGIYWTTSDGDVRMCSLPDCAGGPRVLASGQEDPISIAVSDHCVFWISQWLSGADGSIMSINK